MDYQQYFLDEVPVILEKLDEQTRPKWGKLTPHHMLEHIIGSWRISNGKAQVECLTPPDQLEQYRQFLLSDKPYEKNIPNPIMGNELMPLRKESLQSAKSQLLQEISDFFDFHHKHPDSQFTHPLFGPLSKEEWLKFQYKHMRHHFTQFDLI